MGDILSQHGDRQPGPWPRRVAMLAVLMVVTVVIIEHLPHHPPARTGPRRAAAAVVPLPGPPAGPYGVSGPTMSRDDNGGLAMQLDVVSMASRNPPALPTFRVSSDALVGFGWPVGGDDLVAELNFMTKLQVTSWHPGAHGLAVAVISPGRGPTSLIMG